MPYSPRMRAAVGAVRDALSTVGLTRQSPRFARHGDHRPDADAPLVLVACSGGRDSMALAAVAGIVCASLGLRCGAAVIDHGLQANSSLVAQEAAERCSNLGLSPVIVRTVHVCESGQGIESAARQERYQALVSEAHHHHASAVLLAHTRDDQAETVLIGLLRSGGVDAVAGMPESFERNGVRFLRPFLDLSRSDTTGICRELGLTWWDDPTNGPADGLLENTSVELSSKLSTDPAKQNSGDSVLADNLPVSYPLRSRIRHDLLPFLQRFTGGDVVTHLAEASRSARRDKSYLDAETDKAMALAVSFNPEQSDSGVELIMRVPQMEALHPAIRLRVIAHALSVVNIPCNSRHIEAINRLITDWHGQGAVFLPRGHSVIRQRHVIRVCQDGTHANCRRTG